MNALMELSQVDRAFQVGRNQEVLAVDNVNLRINEGEVLCLVGESGCGKTTTGKIVAGLLKPTGGSLLFQGKDVWQMERTAFRNYRHAVQIIHQDPYASLNPTQTIYSTIRAPLLRHGLVRTRREARKRAAELLEMVDLIPPEDLLDKYPHQLSGGQRQRVVIARALTVNPSFIVADEAVSMLDVSIRVSLLKLLGRLRDEMGVTFLFITHDLAIAKYFAWDGRIAVMYLGRVVEVGRTPEVVNHPQHPYTRALLSALPEADPETTRNKERIQLRSPDVPSLLNVPSGCSFHPRCPLFERGVCEAEIPVLVRNGQEGTQVACHIVAREYRAG